MKRLITEKCKKIKTSVFVCNIKLLKLYIKVIPDQSGNNPCQIPSPRTMMAIIVYKSLMAA